jgi:polysulfide reductase chain C
MFLAWLLEWDAKNNPDKYSYNMEGGMSKISKVLAWIGFIVSIILFGYTGVLLANTGLPLWSTTALLPALFSVSAVSTGIALLVVVSLLITSRTKKLSISHSLVHRLAEADAIVIVVETLVLIAFAVWLAIAGGEAGTALSALLTGELAVMFWVGFVHLALLLPIALDLLHKYKEMEDKTAAWIIGLSAASVIIGGFFLRAVITIGGQL